MYLSLALEMVISGFPEEAAVTSAGRTVTYRELGELSQAAAGVFDDASAVIYLGTNHLAFPVCVFGAAAAGVPVVALNYRLSAEQLEELIRRHPGAIVVHQQPTPPLPETVRAADRDAFLAELGTRAGETYAPLQPDPDAVAAVIYTSGTTAAPKAAVLRHRHVMSYITATVEFGSAAGESTLVTVPPYHIAGVTAAVSNVYSARRIVYLESFDARTWLDTVRSEGITQAMVVPTMLARIVSHLESVGEVGPPTLKALSYGGARTPAGVLERALALFPETAFTQAYGLTETSSTAALLGPEDHRDALTSADPEVRARLRSVGRLVPGIELAVRGEDGKPVATGARGLLYLRGDQIAGEYADSTSLDDEGWFSTRDLGWVDEHGYVFIEGRADDTIIRGGENIAPAEIEDVVLKHPSVTDAAVVGVADDEWGQRIVAVVVLADGANATEDELRDHVRSLLRSSKTPDAVHFRSDLPRTDTGKLLRRELIEELSGSGA